MTTDVPEGATTWSCPRCGEQMSSDREACSRCGGAPSGIPIPPKRCPACKAEVGEPALEGKLHCPSCRTEFEDYEEWVRRCRAAAWTATRPAPPAAEEPPPRPPYLGALAASLGLMASYYVFCAFRIRSDLLLVPCLALAAFQAISVAAILRESRHADVVVRLAAGLSALLPPFGWPAVYFVGLFGFFCRPAVVRFFGGRADPLADRFRHPLIAWLIVLLGVLAGAFAVIVRHGLESAREWNESPTFLLEVGARLSGFFEGNWWWAPAGALGGICVLGLWGKVNRHGFLAVSILAIVAMVGAGAPPIVEAWLYDSSAREAATYEEERNVDRLVWGARNLDPKVRVAAVRSMQNVGREARVAVPALVRALKDADRRVRLAAACALAQFDPSVEGVMSLLIAALGDDRTSEEEAERATTALGYFGPRARPALVLLQDRLRRGDAAVRGLAELGPAAIPGLTEGLSDRDAAVRRRSCRALQLIGPAARSAVPLLIDRLKDPDPAVRADAAEALGEIHREKAIPFLREMLPRGGLAAKGAADALCALGERDGLAYLPEGSSSMNALRQPAIWDHLSRTLLEKDLEGSGTEIVVELAEHAVMCAEVAQECAGDRALTEFVRVHAGSRRRSALEVLRSLGVEFVLESDRIRILPADQARAVWTEWLAEALRKRE